MRCQFQTFLRNSFWSTACLLCVTLAATGCLPIPVSTVPLHPREERPVAVESAQSEKYGTFSSPVFDASGALLAIYDSGSDLIRIFSTSDLASVDCLKPIRWPRRLSFSAGGQFLVIETHQGWLDDYLKGKPSLSKVDIDSPEAVRDDIQRAEIWNLRTGQTITDLSCDAVVTSEPKGGWLWARRWAITPGFKSSKLLEAHFSVDEKEFSMLCEDGVQQRWDSSTWKRLENIPPPPVWDTWMDSRVRTVGLAGSADGRIVILFRIPEKGSVPGAIYIWDRNTRQTQQLPGECASFYPVYALSSDGSRIVVVCKRDLGHTVRAWNLGSGQELPLKDANFGLTRGTPIISSKGVALSPDGRYLAVALLGQMEALLPNALLAPATLSRSDLRIWSLDEGKELVSVPIDDLVVFTDYNRGVYLAFSPDSSKLVVSGRRLRIYRFSDLGAIPQ